MIRRHDSDSYLGVTTISMAAIALSLLMVTGATGIGLILFISVVACLSGVKVADILVGTPE